MKVKVELSLLENIILMRVLHTDKDLIDKGILFSSSRKCTILSYHKPHLGYTPENVSIDEQNGNNSSIYLWGREKDKNDLLTCIELESKEEARKVFEIYAQSLIEFLYSYKKNTDDMNKLCPLLLLSEQMVIGGKMK
jgi:hypothetical protein